MRKNTNAFSSTAVDKISETLVLPSNTSVADLNTLTVNFFWSPDSVDSKTSNSPPLFTVSKTPSAVPFSEDRLVAETLLFSAVCG